MPSAEQRHPRARRSLCRSVRRSLCRSLCRSPPPAPRRHHRHHRRRHPGCQSSRRRLVSVAACAARVARPACEAASRRHTHAPPSRPPHVLGTALAQRCARATALALLHSLPCRVGTAADREDRPTLCVPNLDREDRPTELFHITRARRKCHCAAVVGGSCSEGVNGASGAVWGAAYDASTRASSGDETRNMNATMPMPTTLVPSTLHPPRALPPPAAGTSRTRWARAGGASSRRARRARRSALAAAAGTARAGAGTARSRTHCTTASPSRSAVPTAR